jgi:rhodanese-related sulfurtransferase
MSTTNAGLARKLGYTNVKVYLEGEPAWTKAGNKLYASHDFITTGNIVLIDLRPTSKAIEGRIPRSVSVPYDKLDSRLNDIPRNAPVVLYSDNEQEALDALADLREDGFKLSSLVSGNYAGWVAAGGAIESGPIASTDISWKRKIGKGEVTVEEFKAATEGKVPGVMIIDARTKEEIAEFGKFKNTVNIPLDQIPARIGELPKDKKIFIHCSTGARADLAYQELMKHGFNAKFLLLNIEDAACDCEIIRP